MNWVQCDRCEEWFHLLCVGLAEDEVSEEEDYECFLCKQQKQPVVMGGGDYKTIHRSPQKSAYSTNVMDSLNYGNVSVIKTEPDDNQQEIEVTMDTGIVGYDDVMNSFQRSQMVKSKGSVSTKVTQFSFDDDSSQDETKNSYELTEDGVMTSRVAAMTQDSSSSDSLGVPRNLGIQFSDISKIHEEIVGSQNQT